MQTLRASLLFRRAYPARVAARIDRKRAVPVAVAGVLVVAVAVLGALALRDPGPAAPPRSSEPLAGSPPLRLDLPAQPSGGLPGLAARGTAPRVGRALVPGCARGARAGRRRRWRARAGHWARAICACRWRVRSCTTA